MEDKMPSDSTGMSRPTPVQKYKQVKKQSASDLSSDPTKPLSPSNPLMVEKKDGSIGQWGNDLKSKTKSPAQIEADKAISAALKNAGKPGPSEKSQGRSNTYY